MLTIKQLMFSYNLMLCTAILRRYIRLICFPLSVSKRVNTPLWRNILARKWAKSWMKEESIVAVYFSNSCWYDGILPTDDKTTRVNEYEGVMYLTLFQLLRDLEEISDIEVVPEYIVEFGHLLQIFWAFTYFLVSNIAVRTAFKSYGGIVR